MPSEPRISSSSKTVTPPSPTYLTSDPIIRAANDPLFRRKYLPARKFNSEVVKSILTLRKNTLNPANFIYISDLETYRQALRTFPLVQNHPRFDELHFQIGVYFHIINNTPNHSDTKYTLSNLVDLTSIPKTTIYNWLTGKKRPILLYLIERRAATFYLYQQRVVELRKADNGIRSIDDLTHRLSSSHFMFSDAEAANPLFSHHIKAAIRYLIFLQLIEAGYHPRDLEIHFNIYKGGISKFIQIHRRPRLIRIAATVPQQPPNLDHRWVPTRIGYSKLPDGFIEAPSKITHFNQLLPVLEQVPTPSNPDTYFTRCLNEFGPNPVLLKEWGRQYGPIFTPEEKLSALGYILGTVLSDGSIILKSTYSSVFEIELSTKHYWSKQFGDSIAYALTCLGIPTKPVRDEPPRPPNKPNISHRWVSVASPLLTWIAKAVLGFEFGQNTTNTPVRSDWILKAPRYFQVKIIQGLFDGDGWAIINRCNIGVYSKQNQELIHRILQNAGIKAYKIKNTNLEIEAFESIRNAVNLPIFLHAKERLNNARTILLMLESPRLKSILDDLPLIRHVLKLHKQGRLTCGRIRYQIWRERGVLLGKPTIYSLIRKGDDALSINECVIKAYFKFLQRRLQEQNTPVSQLARDIKAETGYKGRISTMYDWLYRKTIPRDVKLAISDGYNINPTLLSAYPHLRRYLPREISCYD